MPFKLPIFSATKRDGSGTRVVDLSPGSKAHSALGLAGDAKRAIDKKAPVMQRAGGALADTLLTGSGTVAAAAVEGLTGEVYRVGGAPADAALGVAGTIACVYVGGKSMFLARFFNGLIQHRISQATVKKCEQLRLEAEAAQLQAQQEAEARKNQIPVEESPAAQLDREEAEAVARLEAAREKKAALARQTVQPEREPAVAARKSKRTAEKTA